MKKIILIGVGTILSMTIFIVSIFFIFGNDDDWKSDFRFIWVINDYNHQLGYDLEKYKIDFENNEVVFYAIDSDEEQRVNLNRFYLSHHESDRD